MWLAMSGHVAMVRSTRTFARRRRLAHHGTASTSAADAERLRERRGERAERGGRAAQVPHASTVTAA